MRLAPRMPSVLEKERIYRLIVKEIPSDLGQETGVGFADEMSPLIFMVPEGAEGQVRAVLGIFWSARSFDGLASRPISASYS